MSKVAIVTAASRGMGAACARELAARGYRLALLARSDDVHDLARELDALAVTGSVTEEADLGRLVQATLDHYGRLDAVINNTGHAAKGDLLALTDVDWHAGVDLLLLNVVRMARLVTPTLQAQRSGVLVNISSFAAVEPSLSFPVSSVVRAGLEAFTRLYAQRYAADGVRMNTLLPGKIDTYPVDEEALRDVPARRAGTAVEIARVAAFLVSDEASYINGQSLLVDGGLVRGL
ncbi:MAG: SDR family oxidoreductase [Anaerolineae bacterium]|nr:SDR family oxidoreductase [Anaerolineae bacterium]